MPDEVTNVTTPTIDVPVMRESESVRVGTSFALVSMPVPHNDPHFSIRDHFAGLAMQGMLAGRATGMTSAPEMMAACAYVVADAMLTVRKAVQP